MQALLNSPHIALTFILLTIVNFTVLAQEEDKSTSQKKAPQTTSAPKNATESANAAQVPAPKSVTKQHKEDLKHYLAANQVQPLLVGPKDYITLITKNVSVNSKGVAILLPDWQQGATNPKAINFLRKKLPLQGWTTISIQPPSKPANYPSRALTVNEQQTENKKTLNDYNKQLAAMINAVIKKANEYPGIILIIAQGNHGAMLVNLLNQNSNATMINQVPNALILLSSYVYTSNKLLDKANTAFATQLASTDYPVLDLLLTHDNPIVKAKAKQRLVLSKQEMKVYYRQRQLNNTAIGYYPEQELLTQINSWLKAIGW